jgi:acyl-CoA synthetase (AMP-forming)/AMP-acid ligase II
MTLRDEALATITAPGQPFEIRTEAVLAKTGHGQALPVFANRERSLGDLLRASTRFGNAEYLVTEHSRLTFAGHYAVAAAFAAALRLDYGVRKGDRVAICAANSPEWIIAFWAATSLGAIGVPVSGLLRISGRRSGLILRGGENVYPAEIENVLAAHPLVAECAVLGVPHQDLGEDVAAIVVTAPGALVTDNELTAFARERLARYKVPSRWLVTTEPLPRNATGKVVRPASAALLLR